MNSQKIYKSLAGEILLKRNDRARRLSIRVSPSKGIWVNIPRGFNFTDGKRFVDKNIDWIKKHQNKLNGRKLQIFDFNTRYNTRFHQLQLSNYAENQLRCQINEKTTHVYLPQDKDVCQVDVQDFIKFSIVETLRIEAKRILPGRVEMLARKHGLSYRKLSIRNSKTRWGSCSSKNNINLSLYLMQVSDHLIDYVILHELCHTIEKNHSSNFWKLLSQKLGKNAKLYQKELRTHPLGNGLS